MRDSINTYLGTYLNSCKTSKDIWNTLSNNGSEKERVNLVVDFNSINGFCCCVENEISYYLVEQYRIQRNSAINHFNISRIDCESIYKCLMEIFSNAIGNDSLQIQFLKLIYEEIKNVLCHILNFSLCNAIYPSQWKKSFSITTTHFLLRRKCMLCGISDN